MTENCCEAPYALTSCVTPYEKDNFSVACYTNRRCQHCLVGEANNNELYHFLATQAYSSIIFVWQR